MAVSEAGRPSSEAPPSAAKNSVDVPHVAEGTRLADELRTLVATIDTSLKTLPRGGATVDLNSLNVESIADAYRNGQRVEMLIAKIQTITQTNDVTAALQRLSTMNALKPEDMSRLLTQLATLQSSFKLIENNPQLKAECNERATARSLTSLDRLRRDPSARKNVEGQLTPDVLRERDVHRTTLRDAASQRTKIDAESSVIFNEGNTIKNDIVWLEAVRDKLADQPSGFGAKFGKMMGSSASSFDQFSSNEIASAVFKKYGLTASSSAADVDRAIATGNARITAIDARGGEIAGLKVEIDVREMSAREGLQLYEKKRETAVVSFMAAYPTLLLNHAYRFVDAVTDSVSPRSS